MSTKAPSAYADFNLLPIAGKRREGTAGRRLEVTNPFSGVTLLEILMATEEDMDEAYQAAARAQPEWAARGPGERSAVMHRAVQILDARKDEIIDWLVRESGSTRTSNGSRRCRSAIPTSRIPPSDRSSTPASWTGSRKRWPGRRKKARSCWWAASPTAM